MLETNTKNWEKMVFEKGIEKGIKKGIEKSQADIVKNMVINGMSNTDIRKITGMSLKKISQIRKNITEKK